MQFHNLSTAELVSRIESKLGALDHAVEELCHLLAELDRRGESHNAMRGAILKHYKSVVSGELTATVVLTFSGFPSILEKLKGMDPKQQNAVACGDPIPVVNIDMKGGVLVEEKPVNRLNQPELDRAIKGGALVPVADQEKSARSEAARQPVRTTTTSRIKVDKKARTLVFGNMKFSPEDLSDALRELGFKIVRIERGRPKTHSGETNEMRM